MPPLPMPPDTDRALYDRASQGDGPAIGELLERHLPGLRLFLRLHGDDLVERKESRSDVVQSVCREVLEGLAGFEYRGEGTFRCLLYEKARSKLIDRRRYYLAAQRDAKREVGSTTGSPDHHPAPSHAFHSPSQIAIRNEDLEQLDSAFAQLPEEYREIITQTKIHGLTPKQIADENGKAPEAVRALLYRALVRLGRLVNQVPRN